MKRDILTDRRQWFRYFPEGSIEFLVATRILLVLLLLAMVIVRDVQRPAVLMAIICILWLDHLLMLWWVIQLTGDLEDLYLRPEADADTIRGERLRIGIRICIPSSFGAMLLAPWPMLLRLYGPANLPVDRFVQVGYPLLIILFVTSLFCGRSALRRLSINGIWAILFLVPLIHWFALHRLMRGLESRIAARRAVAAPGPAEPAHHSGLLALAIADLSWILGVLPWLIVFLYVVITGEWPDRLPLSTIPFCGLFWIAIFAVADTAAVERLQREFISLIRKL